MQMVRTMNTRDIKTLCENPETREKGLIALAEWAKNICLFFGVKTSVAYRVAAILVEGVEAIYQEDNHEY